MVDATIPFAEHPHLQGLPSPYYKETHRRWQRTCREYIHENLGKHALDWERDEFVPLDVYKRFADDGFLLPNLPAPLPLDWLKKLGLSNFPGGMKAEEFDYFHFLIYTDEATPQIPFQPGS
jgi:acyl-CoA dehydrogenase